MAASAAFVAAPEVEIPKEITLISQLENSAVAAGDEKELLMLGSIKCPALITDLASQRAPVRVSAVIDRSGSMSGSSLELVKQTLRILLEALRPTDEFGIIAYDDNITENFALQELAEGGLERALTAVDGIFAGGSTNLSGGLFAGIDQMAGKEIKPENYGGHAYPAQSNPFAYGGFSVSNANAAPFPPQQQQQQQPAFQFQPAAFPPQQQQQQQQPAFQPSPFQPSPFPPQQQQQQPAFQFQPSPLPPQQEVTPAAPPVAEPALVRAPPTGKTVNSVMLFTDGQANAGITDPTELQRELVDRLKKLPQPCTLYTYGFGNGHDAVLLKGLADAASGTYYYIEKRDNIPEAFADCMGGLVSVVAQDLSLRVEGMNGCTIGKALTAFPHEFGGTTPVPGTELQQHANCTIRVRDMCSEEQRDIAVTLRVPRLPAPSLEAVVVARWTLTYRNMLTERSEVVVGESRLVRTAEVGPQATPFAVDRQRNRLMCTEALAQARHLATAGQLGPAREMISQVIEKILSSPSHSDPVCAGLLEDLRSSFQGLQDANLYKKEGHHKMVQYSSNVEQQRGSAHCANAMKSRMKIAAVSAVSSKR